MLYFIDTEFIENGDTIDLISIGIVSEDGRAYYAINRNCDFGLADDWVKKNVIAHLPPVKSIDVFGNHLPHPDYKSKQTIRDEIVYFIGNEEIGWTDPTKDAGTKPEFWGYYSAYDHVALCQLFGTMMNLPKGWPMLTKDLQQLAESLGYKSIENLIPNENEHHALADAKWAKQVWEYLTSKAGNAQSE